MLWYLATPVRPQSGETLEGNLLRTLAFQRALLKAGLRVVAPYIELCRALDDSDPRERSLGMAVDLDVLARCDGMLLAGPRVSGGMENERSVAVKCRLKVLDLTMLDEAAVVEAVNVVECLSELGEGTTEVLPGR